MRLIPTTFGYRWRVLPHHEHTSKLPNGPFRPLNIFAKKDAKARLLRLEVLLPPRIDFKVIETKGVQNHRSRSSVQDWKTRDLRGDSRTPWILPGAFANSHAGNSDVKGHVNPQKNKFFKESNEAPRHSRSLPTMAPRGTSQVQTSQPQSIFDSFLPGPPSINMSVRYYGASKDVRDIHSASKRWGVQTKTSLLLEELEWS
ncbi:hypothetical protein Tco_1166673 [Tanacetum coccineum]